MFGLGTQELFLVLLIVFVLFGATRLPQIGNGVGQAIRNFKKSIAEADEEKPKNDTKIEINKDT